MKQRLRELCELAGVSGREETVRTYILDTLKTSSTKKEIVVDALGNVICYLKGTDRPQKKVMLTAHMDEVGLIITHVTEDGYLRFAPVGGIDNAVLCGARVKIGENYGVIGCKAVHLCKKDEAEKIPKTADLLIDIGADNANEAKKTIAPGDVAVFDTQFSEIQDLILSKALDDRVGCALLLEIAETTPPYDIVLVFTVQEEVGCRGAGTATFAVKPDISVTIEATTAADIADVGEEKQVCKLGDGPVVSFMDKATMYDADLYRLIRKTADDMQLPNQTKTVIAGGNDASAIQKGGEGVRVAAISLPCRYIHSPSCVMSYTDLENTRQLVFELLEVLPK